ncbi:MAG: hypothetical protein NVSMB9_27530 [Isosphaeraceae bacterium]
MLTHLFPNFLSRDSEYFQAEGYWARLWERVNSLSKTAQAWQTPWLGTGSPTLRDGNPIFSAYSPLSRRGIRIIQHPPTSDQVEFAFWLDTYGGSVTDPESIQELVISCALSDASSESAFSILNAWVEGEELAVDFQGPAEPGSNRPSGRESPFASHLRSQSPKRDRG